MMKHSVSKPIHETSVERRASQEEKKGDVQSVEGPPVCVQQHLFTSSRKKRALLPLAEPLPSEWILESRVGEACLRSLHDQQM